MMRRMTSLIAVLLAALAAPDASPRPPATHALLINGGGSPDDNFSSHLAHLRQMLALLGKAGVSGDRVTVLDADGADPANDQLARSTEPDGYTLIAGTELGKRLATAPDYASSSLPGIKTLPATKATLDRWFAGARGRLHPGDTLLLYVTDHGSQNAQDPLDNRIVLWGRRESLSVRQLRTLLGELPAGVRVVALMSQCFSGGFTHLADGKTGALPGGGTCGYFSSTADRPAYGCYPVVAGREGVGHSFEFMEALARSGHFETAHADTLVSDATPDVPLRTSDVFLSERLARAGAGTDKAVDELLRQAWKDRARWEPQLRLLDRIGQAYGLTSPRSLAEVEKTRTRLVELLKQLETHGKSWSDAQELISQNVQRRYLAAHADLAARLTPGALNRVTDKGRQALAGALIAGIRAEMAGPDPRNRRLESLSARRDTADEAAYRMEVRLAVLLRLRTLLGTVAGQVWLASQGSEAERASYDALRKCEDPVLPALHETTAPSPPAFPTLDQDLDTVKQVLPSWMGIVFDDRPSRRRAKLGLGDGPALVMSVLPDSAAQAAGLQPGDVVFGPPEHHFSEPREILVWTMLLPVGQPQILDVQRSGKPLRVTLVPRARPLELPTAGPPKPATPAPPVTGQSYRGATPAALAARGAYLVFFWATWCGPCKQSLPEVLAFSRQRNVPIVAVTDEGRGDLDGFFARWKAAPFPENVLSDEDRLSFEAYAVSGTPTFVLVDAEHRVQSYSVGYSRERGLQIEGWRWNGR
jgi:thiol-disulfide isomerase/thioredoxin